MEWIKKNPHLMALLVCALALIAGSTLLAIDARGFDQQFSSVQEQVVPGEKLVPLDLAPITNAKDQLLKPETWTGSALFVPERYVINKTTNRPEKVIKTSFFTDSLTKLPIPNSWFIDHHQSLSDPNIQFADPDADGFTNEDEWRNLLTAPGVNSTDPEKKDSHPPYYTKLFLKRFIRVQFRLRFMSTDGDPKKPEEMSFQINTLDKKQPSEFLKIGELVPNTRFKLQKFEFKEVMDDATKDQKDVSELTLLNLDTNDSVVLVKERITDSPDSYAEILYEWHLPGQAPLKPFTVKKTGSFILRPDPQDGTRKYKLLDISETAAKIQTPDGEIVSISPDPRQP